MAPTLSTCTKTRIEVRFTVPASPPRLPGRRGRLVSRAHRAAARRRSRSCTGAWHEDQHAHLLHKRSRLEGQNAPPPTHGVSTFQGRARPPAWGGRGASPLLCPPNHKLEYASPFARRRRRSGTRSAQERHPSRHGHATARRPASRQRVHGDAPPYTHRHSKNARGRRGVDGRGAHGGATV
jgi:hypothetical protein